MKRLVLVVTLASVAVGMLAADAGAVEVTVNTASPLYDGAGKVIRQVAAGQRFKAEKICGRWAQGFLPTESGGMRGWIACDALDLDDATRRRLETAGTPKPAAQPERAAPLDPDKPVLLRYRLGQGEVQVYDTVSETVVSLAGTDKGQPVSAEIQRMHARFVSELRGKRPDNEGLLCATVCLRHIELRISELDVPTMVWTTRAFDPEGMKVYDGRGRLVRAVRYGEGELADAPGSAWLLNKPFEARFTDGGEMREVTLADGHEELTLAFMGGANLKDAFAGKFCYPEKPIKPGERWEEEASYPLKSAAGVALPAELTGRIRYTVEGRTMRQNRPTVTIKIAGRLNPLRTEDGVGLHGTVEGRALVDEATGIRIYTTVKTVVTITGSFSVEDGRVLVSATTTQTYKGNRFQ